MLNALRKSASTWVVKIFLGLIMLSFAAWGVGDILRVKPEAAVVTVGDMQITGYEFLNDFNRQVRRMQQSLGPTFDTQQARQLGMVDQVLQQAITRALYDQEVAELELTMSDADIAAWIENFNVELGLPGGLREMGVREDMFPALAEHCMTDACHFANPRTPTVAQYEVMFAEAMGA